GFDQSLFADRIITPTAVAQHADDLKPQWVRRIAHQWCPLPRWWTPSLAYLIEAYYVTFIERLPLSAYDLGAVIPGEGHVGQNVGLGPGDGAKDLVATINRLDIDDADRRVAFAVFAAAYEG